MFQDTWHSNKKNPSAYWHATLSCPLVASNYVICILFRSRFDLVLKADHSLDFLGTQEARFQVNSWESQANLRKCWKSPISFCCVHLVCSVSDNDGALMLLPCSHKHVVAHTNTEFLVEKCTWKILQHKNLDLSSRLSFTGLPDPGTDFKAPGSLTHHRFRHFLEEFSKGS